MGDNLSLVICDEWMFFNPGVLPAIIPTLATGAIFIIISSVAPDGDSPLRKVIDALYPDGKPVIKLLNWVQVFFASLPPSLLSPIGLCVM